ncbi:hypothetical protein C8Q73DRAFT_91293 [Cubamyces lactineus]|nr:hypothetical protein C8Q73DRAFT_91293 [Cubamyces lactineus]
MRMRCVGRTQKNRHGQWSAGRGKEGFPPSAEFERGRDLEEGEKEERDCALLRRTRQAGGLVRSERKRAWAGMAAQPTGAAQGPWRLRGLHPGPVGTSSRAQALFALYLNRPSFPWPRAHAAPSRPRPPLRLLLLPALAPLRSSPPKHHLRQCRPSATSSPSSPSSRPPSPPSRPRPFPSPPPSSGATPTSPSPTGDRPPSDPSRPRLRAARMYRARAGASGRAGAEARSWPQERALSHSDGPNIAFIIPPQGRALTSVRWPHTLQL